MKRKPLNVHVADEHVIIEAEAENAGTEIRTESGILIGYRETGEIPVVGEIVAHGANVPVEYQKGTVLMPPGSHMLNVTDPDFLKGLVSKKEQRKMCVTHYKNIKVIYKDL